MSGKTQLMQQYDNLKKTIKKTQKNYENTILLFQVGDFFETFGQDAIIFADLTKVVLTQKNGHPMAGVPLRSYDNYIDNLLRNGYEIAIARQLETPLEAKKRGASIVERGIIKIITKGTWSSPRDIYRFVLVMLKYRDYYYVTYGDGRTGDAYQEEVLPKYVSSLLNRVDPAAIITNYPLPKSCLINNNFFSDNHGTIPVEKIDYRLKNNLNVKKESAAILEKYFSEKGFTVSFRLEQLGQKNVQIGHGVLRKLEVFRGINPAVPSLISYLDKTQSAMGRRRLRLQLINPSMDQDYLQELWDSVEKIMDINHLDCSIADINKLINKLDTVDSCHKLALAIDKSLNLLAAIVDKLPKSLHHDIYRLRKLVIHKFIQDTINNNVPLGEGAFYDHHRVRDLFMQYEKTMGKINNFPLNLSVKCNLKNKKNLGYFLESRAPLDEPFILKQQLSNCYRYVHPELITLVAKTTLIEEKMLNIEREIFDGLVKEINNKREEIVLLAKLVGICDFLYSSARVARDNNYYKPEISKREMVLEELRHPVIEKQLEVFVSNKLDFSKNKHAIITGPNMGGKSTFLKSVGIAVIMSQAGMFVPCHMKTPLINKIFLRMGSDDNTTAGESTFMIEMLECKQILELADKRSLVLIDEICRGTSPRSGISLALAICKELFSKNESYALISTHYHVLAQQLEGFPLFFNLNAAANITGQLTHKILPGIAKKSFGLEVANNAGLPRELLKDASQMFEKIIVNIALEDTTTKNHS
jgi:DNA mismatch repair protein MutS